MPPFLFPTIPDKLGYIPPSVCLAHCPPPSQKSRVNPRPSPVVNGHYTGLVKFFGIPYTLHHWVVEMDQVTFLYGTFNLSISRVKQTGW